MTHRFVPVALNLYKIRVARDEAGDFFRAARKQKDQYQGIWIVAPDGKVLAAHSGAKTRESWIPEVLDTIDVALAKAGPLTRREPAAKDVLPLWGKGLGADGSVTVACHMRHFSQGRGIGQGALDALTFTPEDWREFAPPEAVRGKSWHLPGKVSLRFSRCLSIVSDLSTMPVPDDVTEVDFNGTVERIQGGVATLSYTGRISALHGQTFNKNYETKFQARLRGTATYDTAKKELLSLLWIFEGTSRNVRPPQQDDSPFAAVVEWRREAKR